MGEILRCSKVPALWTGMVLRSQSGGVDEGYIQLIFQYMPHCSDLFHLSIKT